MPTLYGFAYSEAALSYLETIVPKKFRPQIIRRIEALTSDPHPKGSVQVRTITDAGKPVYRLRSGDYRILYSVRDGPLVFVLVIDHRKNVYRKG